METWINHKSIFFENKSVKSGRSSVSLLELVSYSWLSYCSLWRALWQELAAANTSGSPSNWDLEDRLCPGELLEGHSLLSLSFQTKDCWEHFFISMKTYEIRLSWSDSCHTRKHCLFSCPYEWLTVNGCCGPTRNRSGHPVCIVTNSNSEPLWRLTYLLGFIPQKVDLAQF